MDVILISYPDFFEDEHRIVSSLLEKYDFTFHLRKPNAARLDLACFLKKIPEHLHSKIVVSNEIQLIEQFSLKGIHFSTKKRLTSLKVTDSISKSTSCHSLKEIMVLDGKYDYLFLSPVFPSISKKGYKESLNLEKIQAYLFRKKRTKIYALGGIDVDKLTELKNYYFDGIAVLGAVWTDDPIANRSKIEENFRKIYSQAQQTKH